MASPLKLNSSPARRRRPATSYCTRSDVFGMKSPITTIASIALLWAACWVSTTSCSGDFDSDFVETDAGWQYDDDIQTFSNSSNSTTSTSSSNSVALTNGDFESSNITVNTTVTCDSTCSQIINWTPGGAGVQVLNSATYMPSPNSPKSVYCVMLNNPASTGNQTQGSISTTLATNPTTGKSYTVQYDTARDPDGPLNLWPALKISSVSGSTTNNWGLNSPVYNTTDTQKQITWKKQSFIYTGTGASTMIKFESMTEKYGPLIDNVVILNGQHAVAAAPPTSMLSVCQRIMLILTVVFLAFFHCPLNLAAL